MQEVAASYTDRDGREFLFYVSHSNANIMCYERGLKHGIAWSQRSRNWDVYPKKTQDTLLRIVGWLSFDILKCPKLDPTELGFRFADKGGCGDCSPVYA